MLFIEFAQRLKWTCYWNKQCERIRDFNGFYRELEDKIEQQDQDENDIEEKMAKTEMQNKRHSRLQDRQKKKW